ncbi:MAG: DUF4129 domain-containing protein [Pyrinomonadaceae bacterium]|nr:DUF4129 domain-containing protein [Pyrinomonadaceae bacterium]
MDYGYPSISYDWLRGVGEVIHGKRSIRLGALLLALCLCAGTAVALPIADYRERIDQAVNQLDELSVATLSEESVDQAALLASVQAVREVLPPTETVEWEGGSVHVDNTWLHQALDRIGKLPSTTKDSMETLFGIAERLHALDERFAEVENERGLQGRSKEDDKAQLAAILRRAEYQAAEESVFSRLLLRIREWLRSLFPKAETRPSENGNRALSIFAQTCVVALVVALALFVGWKLAPLIRNRHRVNKVVPDGARVVLGETLTENQRAADLLTEAEALARAGDVRGAIRKAYIALLCELGDRKILRLAQHKTNRDYLKAVRERATLYTAMHLLTVSFEKHWYGFEPATETNWKEFLAGYQQAFAAVDAT